MKTRFSTIDIIVGIKELRRFFGMRVVNVYDIDNKTYLIKLGRPEEKAVILLESGTRIHATDFDWPKNLAPSGFSMKLRKHIKGRRLETVRQLGVDRIVDLQFGSGEAAYHVILELYDRGNIILTDHQFLILNILRPRTDTCQDVKFAVRETYPLSTAKQHEKPTEEKLREIFSSAKVGDPLKKLLIPQLDYGPSLIEHCLLVAGIQGSAKVKTDFDIENVQDFHRLKVALEEAEMLFELLNSESKQGVIIQKKEKRATVKEGESPELLTYDEFHPMLFRQFEKKDHLVFDSFNKTVDEFFSKLESQKLDMKALQQEKSALKKLDNIKKDHEKRIESLQQEQDVDKWKGSLIEMNLELVDKAILIVRSAIANQIDWTEIDRLVKEAQMQGDPVATTIKSLNLKSNQITVLLRYPYEDNDDDLDDTIKPQKVDIDLQLSAYGNSRRYFDKKKTAAKKEQKTIDASSKALKSAEKKTKETLKEVAMTASINKARKTYWFEKFLWFITSENFLVIGGRDQQQNELIVKKYMKPGDLYVHADLHGASSCVIKNSTGNPVPPKSLNEAGTMAICNSAAWDAKVVTSAWWVYHDQVSKTAPSGEYLTTGSFMIRGKKNYLPPSYLQYGFAILFKLEEDSVFRHKSERRVKTSEEEEKTTIEASETDSMADINEEDEDDNSDSEDSETEETNNHSSENLVNECQGQAMDSETVKPPSEEGMEDDTKEEVTEEDIKEEISEEDTKEEIKEEVSEEETKEENKEEEYPDTVINLQHVKGDTFELQRDRSSTSGSIEVIEESTEKVGKGAKLSAKQRREMRKARKAQTKPVIDDEDKVSWLSGSQHHTSDTQQQEEQTSQPDTQSEIEKRLAVPDTKQNNQHHQQEQRKRGQKGKMKKIKDKYKDQDDEEREQRMTILQSAGQGKEDKKNKKGKKGTEVEKARPLSAKQQLQQQKRKERAQNLQPVSIILQPTADLILEDTPPSTDKKPMQKETQNTQIAEEEEEKEEVKQDDTQMLDSLTGIPVIEDELLYGVPVCAPYSALLNYKYKVKLLPGSTKRGKAAKTAVNMFFHEKSASTREKDLIRILKDADVSRNIPGKVKVSAPNLHRHKGK